MSKYKFDARLWASVQRPAQQPVKAASDNSDIHSQVCDVIRQCREGGIDITDGYDNWLHVGMALASEFGEGGRNYFHEVSQHNGGYNLAECDDKYTNILRTGRGEVTIATFFRIARDHGIDPSRTHTSNKKEGERSGDRKRQKTSMATVAEIKQYLDEHIVLRFNVITGEHEFHWLDENEFYEISDRDMNSIWSRICEKGMHARKEDIRSIIESDYSKDFNPFEAYFDSLPEWNPETCPDYIGQLAATVTINDSVLDFATTLKRWLVGMVASLKKKAVNEIILTLVGRQGIGKTKWFTNIYPKELSRYIHTKTNSSVLNKDDLFGLAEFGLIIIEEIDHMSPVMVNQLKACVTVENISDRPAYGHAKVHKRHISTFAATGNNIKFMNDPSGNRRFAAFEVTDIVDPYSYRVNYEGVFSQALYLFTNGEQYWFSREEMDLLNSNNNRFESVNIEEEMIQHFYRLPNPGEKPIYLTTAEILTRCNSGLPQKLSAQRIGTALTKLGFQPKKKTNSRGYLVVEKAIYEINNDRMVDFEEDMPF